jgi:hypothetical protein
MVLLALALLGGAIQAPDLASPSSTLVDEADEPSAADVPAPLVIAVPDRRVLAATSPELLAPVHRFTSSIFRPPRAVTFR